MRRQQQRLTDAEHRLAGRALLDADDYARVEERIDAASALRRAFEAMQQLGDNDRRLLELVAVDGLTTGEAAKVLGGHGGRDPGTPAARPDPAACPVVRGRSAGSRQPNPRQGGARMNSTPIEPGAATPSRAGCWRP